MLLADNKLQQILLKSKSIDKQTLSDLLVFAKESRNSLQETVIEKGVLSDDRLGGLIAEYLKLPFISLARLSIREDVLHIIPERLARKYKVILFDQTAYQVNLATPLVVTKEFEEMLAKKTSKKVVIHYATERDTENMLQLYRKDLQQRLEQLLKEEIRNVESLVDEAPIAKIVDLLITYAYRDKASDIHIEPEEDSLLIRFRIDGVLYDELYMDKRLTSGIVTRIKVLSHLRTDEHLSAQDGKMRLFVDEENLDIRVSVLPSAEGEKVVLRLLSSRFRPVSLSDMGMSEKDLKKVTEAIRKSYGLILATGPTGSGKTTTIYSLIKLINTRDRNITTIEDPIEYRIKGVTQTQVNVKTGLTFANGLRSILRQDPNVIFVGEIRDSETAGIAVNSALTGHMVVSTLHTNDAATALLRLIDMKVEPFLVASTVSVIIGQRLVRKICINCRVPVLLNRVKISKNVPDRKITQYFGTKNSITVYEGKGCKTCHYTGFVGRIGIFEVIEMSEAVKNLIIEKFDSKTIEKRAITDGMTTMFEDGLQKVAAGITTLDEILRVTKIEAI